MDKMGVRHQIAIAPARNEGTGTLTQGYTDESGLRHDEDFDLVVLSVGLSMAPEATKMARNWAWNWM